MQIASVMWALRCLPPDLAGDGVDAAAQQRLGAQLLAVAERRLAAAAGCFEPAELASTLRSAAELGLDLSPAQLALVVQHAARSLPGFAPAVLASLLHSLLPAGGRQPGGGATMLPLFEAAAPHIAARAAAFSTSDLARVCWAYATLGVQEPGLMAAVADAVAGRCGRSLSRHSHPIDKHLGI